MPGREKPGAWRSVVVFSNEHGRKTRKCSQDSDQTHKVQLEVPHPDLPTQATMYSISALFLLLLSLFFIHPAQGTFLYPLPLPCLPQPTTYTPRRPLSKRQSQPPRDFQWGLYAYSEPNCQGDLVAAWQGDDAVEACIPFSGAAQSIAGGSGAAAETAVNLWEDGACSVAAEIEGPRGVDGNGYPCFNGVVRSFTVG